MEIRVSRKDLMKGFGSIQGIVERKTTSPILTNALFEAGKENITVTATDLEVGMSSIFPADVREKGKVLVHARSFFDIVRELSDDGVNISVKDGNWIEIVCGRSRYKIVGLPTDEFPVLPVRGQGDIWGIENQVLSQMIDRTAFAMSSDETRFNLNGVCLDTFKKGDKFGIRMVATDGHRLSIVDRDLLSKCSLSKGVIIPRKGVTELKKLIEGDDGAVDVFVDAKNLIVYRDNITLVVRLIEGQFPPYEQVIPKQLKKVVSVSRDLLIHALKRVSVLSSDRARGVKFSFSPKNMSIFASNPDIGEAREELDVSYKGETFEVGFNARYFLDALSSIDDDQAVLQLGDETSPCVLRSELDRGFTHVIMPMRL